MKISACVIAKNEEKNIGRCFASYWDVVSEIILVDTGSTDRTVEIARQYGAKIYSYQWNHDFAAAKNFALDKAKGQWIVFLDADEYFDGRSSRLLPRLLKKIDMTKHNAIGCKITNIDIDNNSRVIDTFLNVRIFKNDKNIRYRNNVHEGLYHIKNGKLDILVLYDDVVVYHTGYSSSIVKGKAERNLEILLENIDKHGDCPDYYRYLCDCYLSTGDYDRCIHYGKMHIESGIKTIGYQSKIYKNIIDAMYLKHVPKTEIEEELKKAIEVFPDHPNFYYKYGFFLFDERRYEEALQNLLMAEKLNLQYNGIEVNFAAGMMHYIYAKIGYIYHIKNQEEQSLEYYYKSLKLDRFNASIFHAMFDLVSSMNVTEVIGLLNTVYNIDHETDIGFLVDELKKVKAGEVFGYYVNIWRKKFGQEDNALAFLLLAMERYDTAFSVFFRGAVQDPAEKANVLLAAVAAIAGGKREFVDRLAEVADPSLRRVLQAYQEGQDGLIPDDWADYLALLREIMLLNNRDVVGRYAAIAQCSPELSFQAAKVLQDGKCYAEAAKLYTGFLSQAGTEQGSAAVALMGLGYCQYKRRCYKEALECFYRAVETGYNKHDVHEFIRWAGKQVS
ncbi:MAG: glycosyltransferase [Negativicutes bacterium]|nr:glycosyltransferase [Negativicutes bacterium]